MAESKRLAAHRALASAAAAETEISPTPPVNPGDEDEQPTPEIQSGKKDKAMDDEAKAAVAAAKTEGFTEATQRMNAVFASEHYAGREGAAAKMLGKPSMTAEDIIDVLADMPKAAPAAAAVDPAVAAAAAEKAGREEMAAAIAATQNSDIDAGNPGKKDARAEADSVWTKAYGLKQGVN